jgi:hypothetical protein
MPRGGTPRLDFPHRIRSHACVGGADRDVRVDRAGCLVQPGLRQAHHVGALFGGKPATPLADKDHDGLIGFLDGDGVTQAIIIGNACRHHFFTGTQAAAERDGDTDQRPRHA